MAKRTEPYLARISENAMKTLPATLVESMPAYGLAYVIETSANGNCFISSAPDAIGRVCTSVKSEDVEAVDMPKPKDTRVAVDIQKDDESYGIVRIAPGTLTDAELFGLVRAAFDHAVSQPVDAEHAADRHDIISKLVDYMNAYGMPAETMPIDMVIKI